MPHRTASSSLRGLRKLDPRSRPARHERLLGEAHVPGEGLVEARHGPLGAAADVDVEVLIEVERAEARARLDLLPGARVSLGLVPAQAPVARLHVAERLRVLHDDVVALLLGELAPPLATKVVVLRRHLDGLLEEVEGIVLFVLTLLVPKLQLFGIIGGIALLFFFLIRKTRKNIMVIVIGALLASSVVFSVNYVYNNVLQLHQRTRIDVLLGKQTDLKGAGYNVNQSKIAIGSGEFWGKGFLQGTQTKYDFVPEQSTDFIFCTVGEEWGFVGSFVVISLFMALLARIIYVAERQRSQYSRIYGYGVASILFFHLMINIGMTIGLAPVIGIPLPFFSYGGSSLWSFTILLFIFIKLDAYRLQILR